MNMCIRYKLRCRIRHHIYKMRQYNTLRKHEHMIYGTEWLGDDDLYQKQLWHKRYAFRLRKLLGK